MSAQALRRAFRILVQKDPIDFSITRRESVQSEGEWSTVTSTYRFRGCIMRRDRGTPRVVTGPAATYTSSSEYQLFADDSAPLGLLEISEEKPGQTVDDLTVDGYGTFRIRDVHVAREKGEVCGYTIDLEQRG
jgi:hypothetical protein